MDPNETLRLIRATIAQMRVDTDPDIRKAHADEVAEYFEALDGWLSTGGVLPDAWRHTYGPPKPLEVGDRISVRWAGGIHRTTVLQVFKNGKVRVQIGSDRWVGGRPGSSAKAARVIVEPWQIVEREK